MAEPEYSYLPYEKLFVFDTTGEAGKIQVDFVHDEDGIGVAAKSLYIENVAAAGTIYVGLSPDGYNTGRVVALGPGARRNYEVTDRVRFWGIWAYSTVIGAQLAVGATGGEWTEEEWMAYCVKVGAIQ